MFAFILSSINGKKNMRKVNILFFIFNLFINFGIFKCDYQDCKTNQDLSNTDCFNNIIKFENNNYRAGRFEKTKDGGLIIEYSENTQPGKGRLFYRLTKDGRGYYENDNPIREFNITTVKDTKNEKNDDIHISSRYEARNALIVLDGDTSGKEYLFSTSCWYSYTELHDLETGNFFAWFTPDFFGITGKYIFSYNYEILRQPGTNNYFIIYCEYDRQEGNDAYSESYFIRKFKLTSFGETNPYSQINKVSEENNENDRIISAFIMETKQIYISCTLLEIRCNTHLENL